MRKCGAVSACVRTHIACARDPAPIVWAPLSLAVRTEVKVVKKEFDKTEDDLKALQSVGQIIGEVLRQLDEERCAPPLRPAHLLICRRRRCRRRATAHRPARGSYRQGLERAALRGGMQKQD